MTTTATTIDIFKYRPEDGGVLDAWRDVCGDDWIYVTGFEAWYAWTGTHYKLDDCQRLQRQIQTLLDKMNRIANDELAALSGEDDNDEAIKAQKTKLRAYIAATTRTRNRVASIEVMAQAHRAVAADRLNTLNVLNLKNGTLDLNTLTLKPHNRDDYLAYVLDYEYDPEALAPRFEQFVAEVLVKEGTTTTDFELCQLFQELIAISLTNETKYEVMMWLSGSGGNGKTIVIKVIQWLLGTMACNVNFETIGQMGNYDLADVQGKRVIFSTESERGSKASEGYIKRIVSGETINARAIYGKPFEFQSIAKIWWAMNDKPLIKDTGNSIWRRLQLIPFNREFTEVEKDTDLLPKLHLELPGILNFALDGLRRLRQRGRLPESKAVAAAIDDYRKENNPVLQWKDERTTATATADTPASDLYGDYRLWALQDNGRHTFNSTNFGKELKRLKIAHRENCRHSRGIDQKVCNRYALEIL